MSGTVMSGTADGPARFKTQPDAACAFASPATTPTAVARPGEGERENGEHHCADVCALATRTGVLQKPGDHQKAQRPEREEPTRQPQRDRKDAQHVYPIDRPPRTGICPGGYTQFAWGADDDGDRRPYLADTHGCISTDRGVLRGQVATADSKTGAAGTGAASRRRARSTGARVLSGPLSGRGRLRRTNPTRPADSLILDLLAGGMSIPEILDDYHIEEADVRACLAYGAEMARERYVTVHAVAS